VTNLKDYLPEYRTIEEFKAALHEKLCGTDGEAPLPQGAIEEINSLADNKFRTWEWNIGKSPSSAFHTSGKFACGTVEVNWSVRHGLLEDVRFSGDFIGNLPAERLASCLDGLRYDKEVILAALKEAGVRDYFDGLMPDDLAALLIFC
jgi:lipoate-protein ligase A